jgi:hypothetical protein
VGAAPLRLDVGGRELRFGARTIVGERDVVAGGGERVRDGCADPLASGDECGARDGYTLRARARPRARASAD